MRKTTFENGEYYHVYNRGVDKRDIFLSDNDRFRFLESMREFNQVAPVVSLYIKNRVGKNVAVQPLQNEKLVEIISYCLLPNHFHLILKQEKDGGISEFMKRLGGGYTWFFNYRHERSGSLFQGRFKSIHIDSNEYLLYLSAYVSGNNFVHGIRNDDCKFSSLYERDNLASLGIVSNGFKNMEEYKKYVKEVADEVFLKREEMKIYILE